MKAIKEYAPKDEELHRIARDIQDMQKRHFYGISAKFRYSYHHGYSFDTEDSRRQYGWTDTDDAENTLRQAVNDLLAWLCKALQNEYESRMSDEYFQKDCDANGYTFDSRGNIDYL